MVAWLVPGGTWDKRGVAWSTPRLVVKQQLAVSIQEDKLLFCRRKSHQNGKQLTRVAHTLIHNLTRVLIEEET